MPSQPPHDDSANAPQSDPPDLAVTEAMDFLYGRINYERLQAPTGQYPFRLARMRALLRELDHPDASLKIVHIAGTKGKGSTSAMVAAMLSAGGHRTGLYTSPHLNHLGERFRIDGVACSDHEMVPLIATVRQAAERLEQDGKGAATFFELTTAVALLHFHRGDCQMAVLEVGLGGRLDSTNVCSPLVTAITSIGLDHQHILGDTLAEIATEKAGILKPGIPAISGIADGPAQAVIEAQARRVGAPLWQRERDFSVSVDESYADWGTRFDFHANRAAMSDRIGWTVPLEGKHQARNAAVALAIMDALAANGGPAITLSDQHRGLAATNCTARIERFRHQPNVIVDAAHNVDSIAALCEVVRRRCRDGKVAVVFGTSQDKDAAGQLVQIVEVADELILTRFHGNPRWQDPVELAAVASQFQPEKRVGIATCDDPREALTRAQSLVGATGWVIVCGSFFLAAEVRPFLLGR